MSEEFVGVFPTPAPLLDITSSVRYHAQLRWQGTKYSLGEWDTDTEAAKAYDWAARLIGGGKPLNFALDVDLGEEPQSAHAAKLRAKLSKKAMTAECDDSIANVRHFLGVSSGAQKSKGKRKELADDASCLADLPTVERPDSVSATTNLHVFHAFISWRGERYELGSRPTALAAAMAHDWAARLVSDGRPLNFVPYAELGWPPRSAGVTKLLARLAEARAEAGIARGAHSQAVAGTDLGSAPQPAGKRPRGQRARL